MSDVNPASALPAPLARDLLRLARPKQWIKGGFVLLGPLYGAASGNAVAWSAVGLAFLAFGLAASAGYIENDIRDRDADRHHPRKKLRPIASGAVPVSIARPFAATLLALAFAAAIGTGFVGSAEPSWGRAMWVTVFVALYIGNVTAYSFGLKRVVMLDVVSLASGFVLRVLAGCAAAGVEPSTWLLNCTLFVSMFLAFTKRLGERRTAESGAREAQSARLVQKSYTDELLRMAVVVTAVASLVTYAGYVQGRERQFVAHVAGWGFNVLWLTILPATFALLRCIVLVERGSFDDPTELAWKDRPIQIAVALFGAITVAAAWSASGR